MEKSIQVTTKGRFRCPDGITYDGEIRNGKPHGQGTTTFADGTLQYKGQYINGMVHGNGTFYYSIGSSYKGEFKEGKHNGHGVYTRSDGSQYDGQWLNDKFHGFGVMTDPKGNVVYEGAFENGWFHGQGASSNPDGSSYRGEFKEDKKNGHGVYTYPDGGKYDGQWREGMMHGHGISYDCFGIITYDGMWIGDIPAGDYCPRASRSKVGETGSEDGVADISPRLRTTLSTEGTHSQEKETKSATRHTSKHPPCAQCGKDPGGGVAFLRCSKCRKVSYCDSKCQRAAWNEHKKVCKERK